MDGSDELSNLVAGNKILNDLMAHYIKNEYPESELTGKIIGAAVEVHKHLAMGFRRLWIQRALSIELNLAKIDHVREKEMDLEYKGNYIGKRRADFFHNISSSKS